MSITIAGNENASVTVANVTPLDDLAPRLANVSPSNGSRTTDHTPTVSADFVDVSGVDNASTKVSDGTYTVKVRLNDSLGNVANRSWSFEVYTKTSSDDDGGGGVTKDEPLPRNFKAPEKPGNGAKYPQGL